MTALYLHLPFCKKKCSYCDFVSYAGKEEMIEEYVDALIREIESLCSTLHSPLSTIFFGGGTPTLLEPKHFEKIFEVIESGTRKAEHGAQEVSIEANPGTANLSKLKSLRALGINRLSIGVQSFNDKHLQTLGRIHSAQEAINFYQDARAAGFDNINLDLMFALPGQTLEEWRKDLQIAIDLKPNHLSTYNLELHPDTPLWSMTKSQIPISKQISNPKYELPNEDQELAMFEYTIETLTARGYKHYEISNFAKPGSECRHNINYWKNGNYIGVGAGAHSHFDGKRWANPDDLEEYMGSVGSRWKKTHDLSPDSSSRPETIFLGLRLLDGLETAKFHGFEKEVQELIADGLLERHQDNFRLTRKGLYLANEVFSKFV